MSIKSSVVAALPTRLYLDVRRGQAKYQNRLQFEKRQFLRRSCVDGYSLESFDRTRSIFVHVPKCAGVAIAKALYGNLGGGHFTLDDYLCIFEPKAVRTYFKFAIVRNPWDRLVSAFHFLKAGGMNQEDKSFSQDQLSQYDNFDVFVRSWVTEENIERYHHFRPQWRYITDYHDKISLDFIGRFENLGRDFSYIAKRIGKEEVELPTANSVSHAPYCSYYSKVGAARVNEVYKRDIEILGYSF
jgi:hypothetical protein